MIHRCTWLGPCCSTKKREIPGLCGAGCFRGAGVAKGERRTYRLWEEGEPPEESSKSPRAGHGWKTWAPSARYTPCWGTEYFLYDPLGESLRPPLQGYRLQDGEYQRLPPGVEGSIVSQALGLELRVEDGRLRVFNPTTGERLLTPAEALLARRVADARVSRAEAEVERLRTELARLRGETRA